MNIELQFINFLRGIHCLNEFCADFEFNNFDHEETLDDFLERVKPNQFVVNAFDWTSSGDVDKWLSVSFVWDHYIGVSI